MSQTVMTASVEQRKARLAEAVAEQVRGGWGVQSQTDFQAVMVKGHRPNHLLHFLLALFTLGLWAVVWIAVTLAGGEKHRVVNVDEYGRVLVT